MEKIQNIADDYINRGLYPGIEWKIIYKGETFQGRSGYLNLKLQNKIKPNTLYRIWSMTKPIISCVILQLIEQNKININDSILEFLPEFSNLKVLKTNDSSLTETMDINRMPSIKDLLMHTAGFSYNFLGDPIAKEYEKIKLFHSSTSSLKEEINHLSTLPLLYQPSTQWLYSVSVDILARIIEVVTKKSLQSVLIERIFKPLDMNDTRFFVDEDNLNKLMQSYEYDPLKRKLVEPNISAQKIGLYGYPENNKSYARGGHGLFSTLNDYSNFAQMLLSGNSINNEKILSESMIKNASTNHLNPSLLPISIKNFDVEELEENDLEPYGWGLGFRVMQDPKKTNMIGNIGEFGWSGAAATYFLVDPKIKLTAVIMTQVLGAENNLKKDIIKEIYNYFN